MNPCLMNTLHEHRSIPQEQVDALLALTGVENSMPIQAVDDREIASYGSGR